MTPQSRIALMLGMTNSVSLFGNARFGAHGNFSRTLFTGVSYNTTPRGRATTAGAIKRAAKKLRNKRKNG